MFLFCTKPEKKSIHRQYIDLIQWMSGGKWPNYKAPKDIHVGDFGTFDEISGDFFVEGNIYTHPDISDIAVNYPTSEGVRLQYYGIVSSEVRPVRGLDAGTDAGANAPSSRGIIFNARWQFNTKRAAILLMFEPCMTRVPWTFFSAATHLPVLENKRIVDQVYNCPGFYMYLSGGSSETMTISLRQNATTPASPADNNTAPPFSWFSEGYCDTGIHKYAYERDAVYAPLFHMMSMEQPQVQLTWWDSLRNRLDLRALLTRHRPQARLEPMGQSNQNDDG